MSKTELRTACKTAGITGYGKMNNDQMRAALEAHAAAQAPVAAAPAESTEPVVTTPPAADAAPAPSAAPAAAEKPAKPARPPAEERNGVKKPGPGKCLDVWNAMDQIHATGKVPTSQDAKLWAESVKANASNATQELARWRRFNGVQRATKETTAA